MHQELLQFTKKLISLPSVTPNDRGCQNLIAQKLTDAQFQHIHLPYGKISNLFSYHGQGSPYLIFVGHTDVVPAGCIKQWHSDPFIPREDNGYLYGRGAADMKGSVAAMVLSARDFVKTHPEHKGTIAFSITSDEEGPATHGTISIVQFLQKHNIVPDYVLVGEPSSEQCVGDTIKIGRRGSCHGELICVGQQGHVAYPEKAQNPIHLSLKPLTALIHAPWDEGDTAPFPPTSLQFYDIQSGIGASNVIPEILKAKFNFRYATTNTPESLYKKMDAILKQYATTQFILNFNKPTALPYLTKVHGPFVHLCQQAIKTVCALNAHLGTGGGTSDGRYFSQTGAQIVEIGPVNATIHQANECINIQELYQLQRIYFKILKLLYTHHSLEHWD